VASAPALHLPVQLFDGMTEFCEAAYPYEGCGELIGGSDPDLASVSEVFEGKNLVQDRRDDRYELDPRDIIRAERAARASGQELIGFYHTHPDHPARPSQFDTDRAWGSPLRNLLF
jgi:proteasome lid subunit RPN8/RPN11